MDVIEAHARRLPVGSTSAWTPAARDPRDELARALTSGRVAGVATHPLDNVRGNARCCWRATPTSSSALPACRTGWTLRRRSGSRGGRGRRADRPRGAGRPGPDRARADPRRVRGARGSGSRRAAAGGERVVLATGPSRSGSTCLYHEFDRLARDQRRADVLAPADGARWRDPAPRPRLVIVYLSGGVGMLTDGRVPRHTHWPDAMHRMLGRRSARTSCSPTTGSPARRSRPASRRVAIADVNDPALLVAQAQGRTRRRGRDGRPRRPVRLLAVLPGRAR